MGMHYWTRTDGRYYAAVINQDLFGYWTVVKFWGGKGKSTSQMEIVACDSINTAMQVVASIARVRRAHGYIKQEAQFNVTIPRTLPANEACKSYY